MYEASFGLGPAPFRLLPDPRFYLDDGQYGTLLAQLIEGLEAGEPCLLLTGPAGSGKTAAVQRLLMLLDRARWTVGAMFASADAAGADVLPAVAYAFNLARADMQPGPAFDAWLARETAHGRRVLLVVDEAEHLDEGALRQLAERLMPARGAPGLQLCLVGEQAPASLADAVRDGSLPPIEVHCRLRPLDASETRDYVLHRLRCAGWKGRPAFDRAATDAIHQRSEGIPRRIHLLADRVLLQLSLENADVATATAVEIADDWRTVELQGRTPVEALPADVVAPSRAGPNAAAHAYGHMASAQRIEPPVPPVVTTTPAPPRQIAPDGLRVSSPAEDGGSPGLPGSVTPDGTESAGTAMAAARDVLPGRAAAPRWTAAGAIVVALAGIGWWLGVGGTTPPPAAPLDPERGIASAAIVAPAPAPAPAPASAPASASASASASAPAPASAPVTAEPAPVAGPSPPASPSIAAPPQVTATARTGTGAPSPSPRIRSGDGRAPTGRSGRDAMPAGEPLPITSALPASPKPGPCTPTAAALGLCEAAATPTQPASPPARMAVPAADAASPEPPRAEPRAAPTAPCEPSRAALGLCER